MRRKRWERTTGVGRKGDREQETGRDTEIKRDGERVACTKRSKNQERDYDGREREIQGWGEGEREEKDKKEERFNEQLEEMKETTKREIESRRQCKEKQ